jgi:Protein of unknown function (DUF3575)
MKKFIMSLPGITGLLFSLTVSAQKNKQIYQPSYPEYSLHTSLTSFFDDDAGFMLGVNYRWSKHFSASLEPTWIFYNFYNYEDGTSMKIIPSGIKIRADFRYYFKKRKPKYPDFYISPEFHYKHTNTKREGLFGMNLQNGQYAYFQNAVYTDIKNEIGGFVKTGIIVPLRFVKNHRWLIDMYIGIGGKQYNYRETDLPVGGSFIRLPARGIFGNSGDSYAIPMVPAGFKLIFIL